MLLYADPAADEKVNMFEAFVDGIDISSIVAYGSIPGGVAASAADQVGLGLENGGALGAETVDISTEEGPDTEVWTDLTPRQFVMKTTVVDVDKGDWVNMVYNESGTVTPKGFSIHVQGTYGIPGGVT